LLSQFSTRCCALYLIEHVCQVPIKDGKAELGK
jgi:hypothetical protein